MRFWREAAAAGAVLLTIGVGQACADPVPSPHDGGPKAENTHVAAHAFGDHGAAKAFSADRSTALGGSGFSSNRMRAGGDATVEVDDRTIRPGVRSHTVTTITSDGRFLASSTRSTSIAIGDDGDAAFARAFAQARAPNNVTAVRNGAGKVFATTSVSVTGNGRATAEAGGSIGVSGGAVKVSTWGETSAEVF
jgi:hypothetical protein